MSQSQLVSISNRKLTIFELFVCFNEIMVKHLCTRENFLKIATTWRSFPNHCQTSTILTLRGALLCPPFHDFTINLRTTTSTLHFKLTSRKVGYFEPLATTIVPWQIKHKFVASAFKWQHNGVIKPLIEAFTMLIWHTFHMQSYWNLKLPWYYGM